MASYCKRGNTSDWLREGPACKLRFSDSSTSSYVLSHKFNIAKTDPCSNYEFGYKKENKEENEEGCM